MKKYLYFLLISLSSLSLHATSTAELKFISNLLKSTCNIIESNYEEESEIITYKTRNGKEHSCIYVWNEANKEEHITIDKETLQQAKQVDFIIIGYGQSSCNPAHYYFMPSNHLKTSYNVKMLKRFLLLRPICNNKFE